MELRLYQKDAVEAVYNHLREKENNPGVVIPTGGGKTPVLATIIRDAIVDKNARIGDDCVITPAGKPDGHHPLYTVAGGIIVIPKNTSIPPGTKL